MKRKVKPHHRLKTKGANYPFLFPDMRRIIKERPYQVKLKATKQRVKAWVKMFPGKCAIACSFGKDSMVLLHMALQVDPQVLVMFNNSGIEYPETIKLKKQLSTEWDLNLVETRPTKTFWECLKEYGLPHVNRYINNEPKCCYHIKTQPAMKVIKQLGIQASLVGIRAQESLARLMTICQKGIGYYSPTWGTRMIRPIAEWTETEVWKYHEENNLPINEAYSHQERIGCAFCTAFKDGLKKLAIQKPLAYRRIMSYSSQTLLE
jgi:phosphoadenosine phosphosulfate reductase